MAKQIYFLLVLSIILAVVKIGKSEPDEKMKAFFKTVRATCMADFVVTEDTIDGFKTGNFPEDKMAKCYVNCAMEQLKTMKDGKFLYEETKAMLDKLPADVKGTFLDAMEKCKSSADGIADHCEASYAITKCFQQNNPKFCFP